jgi:glycosyltransferase involved in cell wall biosynthesis
MKIGIDASRAFLTNRTGIEEYSYQTIKNLRGKLNGHQVVLYLRKNQSVDFELPENWQTKIISWKKLWTQGGLSLEMFLHPVDALFVPAHTVPFIHPEKTIVTVHGLEYEFCPKAYSMFARVYMRLTIRKSCQWASKIISVSENTKKDLMELYHVSANKIVVVYEGYEKNTGSEIDTKYELQNTKYLLFVGRVEERKNIENIVKAFEILKQKHAIAHKLILAGKPGHGFEEIKTQISNSKFKGDILELGFVKENEKWELLKNADVFVFPTKYEGFGIPVLEAQSVGCPVVAASNSSIPEVAAQSAILTDCESSEDIAENIYRLLSDESLKNAIIAKGLENVKRFSWEKCAQEISLLLLK